MQRYRVKLDGGYLAEPDRTVTNPEDATIFAENDALAVINRLHENSIPHRLERASASNDRSAERSSPGQSRPDSQRDRKLLWIAVVAVVIVVTATIGSCLMRASQRSAYRNQWRGWDINSDAISDDTVTELGTRATWRAKEIPAKVFDLTNLRELYLGDNQLTEIPADITKLNQLNKLIVGGNQLTEFPTPVTHLSQLTELHLGDNFLQQIPAELAQLRSLKRLNLTSNVLVDLPAEIGTLTSLEYLDLSDNYMKRLPSAVDQLVNLKELDLRWNEIEEADVARFRRSVPACKVHYVQAEFAPPWDRRKRTEIHENRSRG